ncbi:MAG: 50S ribosomal protein L22 [Candidatus Magasanikbacteria bacterium]|nr:50S ribosomal protein L22 [Candidatus Magasanikbacteria bacterium]
MIIVTAQLNKLRMSPKKVRLVLDTVRGLRIASAEERLLFTKRGAAAPVLKLLRSAIANAVHNHKARRETLRIASVRADEGAVQKRWRPRAHGRAFPIRQRMSQITMVLKGEAEGVGGEAAGASEKAEPEKK